MALSGTEDPFHWDEEDNQSLTKSGNILKEEHIGLWADANKLKISLENLFLEMKEVIDLGLKNMEKFPMFPCFSVISEMGEHLNLPWKTISTAFHILWRHAQTKIAEEQKRSGNVPEPGTITSTEAFNALFASLSPRRIHILSYGCLILASKSEETLFSLRVLEEHHHAYMVLRGEKAVTEAEQKRWKMKDIDRSFDPQWLAVSVRDQEVNLLVELGFNLTIRHLGYFRLLRLMNALQLPKKTQVLALSLANFSLLTPTVLIHRPKLFAITMVFLATQIHCQTIAIPPTLIPASGAPSYWWSLFNASTNDIKTLATPILTLIEELDLAESLFQGTSEFLWPPNENELSQMRSVSLGGSIESGPMGFCPTQSLNDTGEPVGEHPLSHCVSLDNYIKEKKISEGTYGTVYVGRDKVTKEVVAIKKMKRTMSRSGFPYYMLREILFLFRLNHQNIVSGKAMAIEERDQEITFYIVMEFIPTDMLSLVKHQASIPRDQRIRLSQVKNVMSQLLAGLAHMHEQGLMHRDLKLANLLLTREGILKVADLGSVRDIGRTALKLTTQIVTLWYRAPELLMGGTDYSHSIDLWSVGCLFVEMLTLKPMFPGNSELETMQRIFRVLGTPPAEQWKKLFSFLPLAPKLKDQLHRYPTKSTLKDTLSFLSPAGQHFLSSVLAFDPADRLTATEALNHPFWREKPYAQPINLEKIGMVTFFDERNLEVESELMDTDETPNSDFAKKYSHLLPKSTDSEK
eukprot:CAMPEP_0201481198 /NCGR_PEP_ID=MMETSP0151_2-20130828/5497_1 /ASSEMBLY_ACC=CAM_ASM_000257 /TAXON_ID=200890 /ORGANISM="Paramoeba atlantica, Strain 621/1 / CCAP 1560/9" /LENGTH=745 /DNA_ID=CAMNT_0047863283 /DNA_START=79 /DNA_END=2316 /DNA_ORIENTATION=-